MFTVNDADDKRHSSEIGPADLGCSTAEWMKKAVTCLWR